MGRGRAALGVRRLHSGARSSGVGSPLQSSPFCLSHARVVLLSERWGPRQWLWHRNGWER